MTNYQPAWLGAAWPRWVFVLLLLLAFIVPAPASAAACTYTVQPGDTLSAIAARNGTTVNAIVEANPSITNPNRILVGQQIELPSCTGDTPSAFVPVPKKVAAAPAPTEVAPAPAPTEALPAPTEAAPEAAPTEAPPAPAEAAPEAAPTEAPPAPAEAPPEAAPPEAAPEAAPAEAAPEAPSAEAPPAPTEAAPAPDSSSSSSTSSEAPSTSATRRQPKPVPPLPADLPGEISQRVHDATINIRHPINGPRYSGSGIMIGNDGRTFLTAFHVIGDPASGYFTSEVAIGPFADWKFTADVIASDPGLDLAILRVREADFPGFAVAPLGNSSELNETSPIYTFSYPGSVSQLRSTKGHFLKKVSSIRYRTPLIMTDANATFGSSGGVAVNERGEVIGIITAGLMNRRVIENLGYSGLEQATLLVPIEAANDMLREAGVIQ
ncbi:MAG: trypsin-like peptidase domain-containing protein [Ardenticatenaceae bacterium]